MSIRSVLGYFWDRKPLLLCLSYIVVLDMLDWTSTTILLNLHGKPGFDFYEGNPVTAGWMDQGTILWLINCVGVMMFVLGVFMVYWRHLEKNHPESLKYFLFVVPLSSSLLVATMMNNLRLLVMWAMA